MTRTATRKLGAEQLAASLNVGRSHIFETFERIIFAASCAGDGNTHSATSGAWSLSRGFERVEWNTSASSNGLGIYQLVIESTCPPYPWRPGVLFPSRCLSLAGVDQPRNHDPDHARHCQSRGYLLQGICAAPVPLVGCTGLALAVPHVAAAQTCILPPEPVVGCVSYDRAREVGCSFYQMHARSTCLRVSRNLRS